MGGSSLFGQDVSSLVVPILDTTPIDTYLQGKTPVQSTALPMKVYVRQNHDQQIDTTTTAPAKSRQLPFPDEEIKKPRWKAAMDDEMQGLKKNDTWDLVPLPPQQRTVSCKWVFIVKQNMDGIVDKYMAWLVARGFTQIYDLNYQETFVPMAKMNTIRVNLYSEPRLGLAVAWR
ncbi:uncharacterized mitochondrial protein AtMg00820-like [Macadamia integrifolia]|uniref:uncharacterized mitochondrial protein AtMg00820-like n=1 Tax=Macadamia integrifolia TaxID=60698 RepID=UPI001C4E54F8|nr:uncharacterized mitochondrial protein AtMg00820-like [Macadamia integrifolia]